LPEPGQRLDKRRPPLSKRKDFAHIAPLSDLVIGIAPKHTQGGNVLALESTPTKGE
jgi:hypothetical protein